MQLQNYSMEKLQPMLSCWTSKGQELLSISISRTAVKAVLYVKEGEAGVDFSCSYEQDDVAQDFAWLGNEQALEEILRPLHNALQKEGYTEIKLKTVITLEEYAFTERLDLPELDKKDLEEALNWEVPEHIPWTKGSYSFQYVVKKLSDVTEGQLEDGALAQLQQVYVYAVEHTCVTSLLQLCKTLGWELVAITVAEVFNIVEQYSAQLSLLDFYEAHYTEQQLAEKRDTFAVPIVAALTYLAGGVSINFLPKEDKYRVKLDEYKGIFKWLSCFCFGASFLFGALAYGYHYKEVQQIEALKLKVTSMVVWQGRIQELKHLQAKEEALSKEIKQLEGQKILWSSLLKDFGRLLPQGVWLTKVDQQAEVEAGNNKRVRLILQGKAQNAELVTQLMQNLEQSKSLQKIELVNSGIDARGVKTLGEDQLTSFTIKAEFKQVTTIGSSKDFKQKQASLRKEEVKNDGEN